MMVAEMADWLVLRLAASSVEMRVDKWVDGRVLHWAYEWAVQRAAWKEHCWAAE